MNDNKGWWDEMIVLQREEIAKLKAELAGFSSSIAGTQANNILQGCKPCPFCGSVRIIKGERYFAMCADCGATGPERNSDATVRKFTADWNTRQHKT